MTTTQRETRAPLRHFRWLQTLVFAAVLVAAARPASAQLTVGVGDLFPDFSALDHDNQAFRLSDHRGKVVLLHICAAWCSPCRASAEDEEAMIDALDAAIGADNWLLVDVLYQDTFGNYTDQADAIRWRTQLDTPALTLHGSASASSELSQLPGLIGLDAFPTYIVIAPDGTVSATQVGYDAGLGNPLDGTAALLMQLVIDALPQSPDAIIADLLEEIGEAALPGESVNSLVAKLSLALTLLADDNTSNDAAAVGGLEALINQVQALAGRKIPTALADQWIAAAQSAIDGIGGS